MLVPEIAQKVWCGNLRLPNRVPLVREGLRIAEFGYSDPLVRHVNVYSVVVFGRIIDLDGHADALVLFGLIVWTSNVVFKFFDRLKMVRLVARHYQEGRRSQLNLFQTNVVV